MTMNSSSSTQSRRAYLALDGLSIGDAFGQLFFSCNPAWIVYRELPQPIWYWTDDTAMAVSIVEVLDEHQAIDQDELARKFASRYSNEPDRGYGSGAQRLLRGIQDGVNWQEASRNLFGGEGSLGNGAAMRVAPIGAYFADDMNRVIDQARRSAEITHAHEEGIAGAIAVAVAAAVASTNRGNVTPRVSAEILEAAIEHTPTGATREGIIKARQLRRGCSVLMAVSALGNGRNIISSDTVPFALWCASTHLGDFEEAMWSTVAGGGDMDTNAAIVGGIIALAVGEEGLPATWLERREKLPATVRDRKFA